MKTVYFPLLACLYFFQGVAQELKQPINNSVIAFTISEKDLLPENIAYDKSTKSFFVGSTRKGKIVKIDASGKQTEFISPKSDGLQMVIGMKTDVKRRWLWVCSSGGENLIDYKLHDEQDGRSAGIFKYDLDSGRLIKKYVLDASTGIHFFNDLTVDSFGNVYITHMFMEHSIYTIQIASDILEVFATPSEVKYPNGITISPNEKYLFIAHSEGIGRLEIKSKFYSEIKKPEGIKISQKESIDGLYFYKNSLIGIQPDVKTVQEFTLSNDFSSIVKNRILEFQHPMMNNPTTGVLVENSLHFIANSQFGSFDENGKLFPMERLYEPTILKVKLDE